MATKPICTILILDEVNIRIQGISEHLHNRLLNEFSAHPEGYSFSPKYKLGIWDGKIYFYNNRGESYLYFLDDIVRIINKAGYSFKFEDRRPEFHAPSQITVDSLQHIKHLDTGNPIKLYDYQASSVNTLIEHGSGIINAATGAGKTLLTAALVNTYVEAGHRCLIVVPTQDLIVNTKRELVNCGIDTGEYSGKRKDITNKCIVSTWQALQHNASYITAFRVLLVDEVHLAKGAVLQKLIKEAGSNIPFRFGLTGTIPKNKSDQLSILSALGPVRATIAAKELIDRGILSAPTIYMTVLKEDLTRQYEDYKKRLTVAKPISYEHFKRQYFPDYKSEKGYLSSKADRLRYVADMLIDARDAKGNVLCLVDNIAMGRELAKLIPNSVFVNGSDVKSSTKRLAIYDRFKDEDDLIVLATVHIVGTGLSIRRIFTLALLDIGRSFTRVIQGIGRGLRTAQDKKVVDILDIGSDLTHSKKHLQERIKYYEEAEYPYTAKVVKYDD